MTRSRVSGRSKPAHLRHPLITLTVGGTVKDYIEHMDYHLKFLCDKRVRLGKPLAPAPAVG
jgi:hypothetical protein